VRATLAELLQPWDRWLQRLVTDGRVDYRTWQQEAAAFDGWLERVAAFSPEQLRSDEERLAFWINAYNAFVVASVLERYPIPSIFPTFAGVPNWLALAWFFWRPTHRAGNRRYSLDRIEHRILRRELGDPRLHFAIVCAAVGCPLLRSEAYWPDRVRSQLDADAARFLNNPDKVRYDGATDTLYASKILKWYRRDFLRAARSLPEYVSRYRSDPLSATTRVVFLDYDWRLNEQRAGDRSD